MTPKITNPSEPFYTSTPILNISGTVDSQTQMVTVNDYRLKKYKTGNTRFSYIANADFGTLVPGKNIFEVRAYSRNGQSSTKNIEVFYKPLRHL